MMMELPQFSLSELNTSLLFEGRPNQQHLSVTLTVGGYTKWILDCQLQLCSILDERKKEEWQGEGRDDDEEAKRFF